MLRGPKNLSRGPQFENHCSIRSASLTATPYPDLLFIWVYDTLVRGVVVVCVTGEVDQGIVFNILRNSNLDRRSNLRSWESGTEIVHCIAVGF